MFVCLLAVPLLSFLARADIGDQWILLVDHTVGSGWTTNSGAGYNGGNAYEAVGFDTTRRIYWALDGNSVATGHMPPTSAELYSLEWYRPATGNTDPQPIESQFNGAGGEDWPIDAGIPWAGSYGQNHQWITAQGTDGAPGTWVSTGPGPHAPADPSYTAADSGSYMWLKRGSWLYAEWEFAGTIDHTWSALRLTQRTAPPVIQSISRIGTTVHLMWTTDVGRNYQVQYTTNLANPNWQNHGDPLPASGGSLSKSDDVGSDRCGFYRVVRLAQ